MEDIHPQDSSPDRHSHHKNMIALATTVLFPEKARAPDAVAVMRSQRLTEERVREEKQSEMTVVVVCSLKQSATMNRERSGKKTVKVELSTLVQQHRHGLQSHEERRSKVSVGHRECEWEEHDERRERKVCLRRNTLSFLLLSQLSPQDSLLFNCCRR